VRTEAFGNFMRTAPCVTILKLILCTHKPIEN